MTKVITTLAHVVLELGKISCVDGYLVSKSLYCTTEISIATLVADDVNDAARSRN